MLNEKYSPSAALAKARNEGVFKTSISHATLYKYITNGLFLHLTNNDLPVKKNPKKQDYRRVKRLSVPKGETIENRPKEINKRQSFGHWEMDCVEGKKGTFGTLLVLTERYTRYEIVRHMPRKTADNVAKALDDIERETERFQEIFKSITVDNGAEFSRPRDITKSIHGNKPRTKLYYCHPYCASERGSNENANKLVRRHHPKGTSLAELTPEEVKRTEDWINDYPRKLLQWKTAREVFQNLTTCTKKREVEN